MRGKVQAELVEELRKELAGLHQELREEQRREMRAGTGPKTKCGMPP
jgi:hypothetical protein